MPRSEYLFPSRDGEPWDLHFMARASSVLRKPMLWPAGRPTVLLRGNVAPRRSRFLRFFLGRPHFLGLRDHHRLNGARGCPTLTFLRRPHVFYCGCRSW